VAMRELRDKILRQGGAAAALALCALPDLWQPGIAKDLRRTRFGNGRVAGQSIETAGVALRAVQAQVFHGAAGDADSKRVRRE
jgi:hypothetical protein